MADSSARQMTSWLPLLRESLASEGSFRWPLRGNSMLPTLPDECEIEVRPLTTPLRVGELIVFVLGDTLIVHRFVRRSGEYLIAQGDNRRVIDAPLKIDQVVGRVTAAYQTDRLCWPQRFSLTWPWIIRHYILSALRFSWHGLRKFMRHG